MTTILSSALEAIGIGNRSLVAITVGLTVALSCTWCAGKAQAQAPLPASILQVIDGPNSADEKLNTLMQTISNVMGTDRAFLWVRDPAKKRAKFSHGYTSDATKLSFKGREWGPDVSPRIVAKPLMQRAFLSPHAIFIDDIYDQPKEILNADFQALVFENRALVHAPIYVDGDLVGILQTDQFEEPRDWSVEDIALMQSLQAALGPVTAAYIADQ